MKNFLSLYLHDERIYLAGISPGKKGISINYINATSNPAGLADIADGKQSGSLKELRSMVEEGRIKADFLAVSLPSSAALITQFPAIPNMGRELIQKLVNLELRHSMLFEPYPKAKANLFEISQGEKKYFIAGVIPKKAALAAEIIAKYLNIGKLSLKVDHFSGHSCFSYNYPDRINEFTALIEVTGNIAEISFLKNNSVLHYCMIALPYPEGLVDKSVYEMKKFAAERNEPVKLACIYGPGLNNDNYLSIRSKFASIDIELIKLNPFRMLLPNINETEKDFAARNYHLYPACIGAVIPSYYKTIILN